MLTNLSTIRMHNYTLSVAAQAVLLSLATLPLAIALHTPTTTLSSSQSLDLGKLPLSFEANQGQTEPSVKYIAHASGDTIYFTPSEVVLALQQPPSLPPASYREIPDKDINPRRVNLARYNSDRLSPSFERITGPYKPQG
jgi:hypothetical protein